MLKTEEIDSRNADPPSPVPRWSLTNPHPLSRLKTELVWDGKYDEYGRRREVDIAGCTMPMQRIETIDQPRSEAAADGQLEMWEQRVMAARPKVLERQSSGAFDVKLTKFMPSLAEVPSKELEALKERAIKSGFDFIDFWAVDFEWHDGKPFEHHWQDYRTRKDRSLKTVSDAAHEYAKPGKHTICVKVVDVFGCDTSITAEVNT